MAIAIVEVTLANQNDLYANTLDYWIKYPPYQQPTIKEPFTGQQVSIPEGSISAYLTNHLHEFGDLQTYVTVSVLLKPSAGEKWKASDFKKKADNVAPEELEQALKDGTVKRNEVLTSEKMKNLHKHE